MEKGLLRPEQAEKLSDREALNLIFQPGFSTAETVTNVSGRGVGMDVVKSNIEKIGGIVDVFSRPGEGTTVKLKIPLTLAIIPGLVITSGGERFVIPQVSLLELVRLEGDSSEKRIEHVHGTPVYRRRGSLLPVAYLNRGAGAEIGRAGRGGQHGGSAGGRPAVRAGRGRHQRHPGNRGQAAGQATEGAHRVRRSHHHGRRPRGPHPRRAGHRPELRRARRNRVSRRARRRNRSRNRGSSNSGCSCSGPVPSIAWRFRCLWSPGWRSFPHRPSSVRAEARWCNTGTASFPWCLCGPCWNPALPDQDADADPVQVIVFNDGDRSVGVVVDQILDVAEEAVTVRQKSSRKGLLGSGVVGKQVTDFLDLNQVIHAAAEDWFQGAGGPATARAILVAEASAFSRGLIRSGLDMAGYRVLEAANLDEAIRALEQQPVDVVVAALDLPPDGSSALLAAMRQRPEWQAIPVLALADSAGQVQELAAPDGGFPGLPGEVRPRGHARIGGAAGVGAGFRRDGSRSARERRDNDGDRYRNCRNPSWRKPADSSRRFSWRTCFSAWMFCASRKCCASSK